MSGRRARWSGSDGVVAALTGLIAKGLIVGLGAVVAYAVTLILLHPRVIYPFFGDDRVLDGFERVQIGRDGETPIYVQERAGVGPVVLYFMGNAGSVALFEGAFVDHIAADRHIVALEYRGGAGRPGRPSEAVLKADALRAADYALRLEKPLIVQGFSLGTGLATYVAARRLVERVVLTAPYDRLCRLMAAQSYLPACHLPFVQAWRSLDEAEQIEVPILVLHGAEDGIIHPRYSMAFEALPMVERVVIPGAGHNDIGAFPDHRTAIERFLSRSH